MCDMDRIKKLYVKNIKAKNIHSKHICAESLKSRDINTGKIDASSIFIDGKNVTCKIQGISVANTTETIKSFGNTGGAPANINPSVYNCMIKNAINYGEDLQNRLFEGRKDIADYIASQGCPQSCPPGPTGPVPLEIYGTLTLPIYNLQPCGPTGTTDFDINLTTSVYFNLQVSYLLRKAKSIDARNVSILIQVGYVDPSGPTGGLIGCTGVTGGENVVISEVFVANKQFYPTLDTLYGENFANNIPIPVALLRRAYNNSPPNSQGAVQLVIYKEEGLCIWTPSEDGKFECLNGTFDDSTIENAPVSADFQTVPTTFFV